LELFQTSKLAGKCFVRTNKIVAKFISNTGLYVVCFLVISKTMYHFLALDLWVFIL